MLNMLVVFAAILAMASACDIRPLFSKEDAVFYVKGSPSGDAVIASSKGCLDKTTDLTLSSYDGPKLTANDKYLVFGSLSTQPPAATVEVACWVSVYDVSLEDRAWLASQMQMCKSPSAGKGKGKGGKGKGGKGKGKGSMPKPKCPFGKPGMCNKKTVCGLKPKFKKVCQAATKCMVNSCGGSCSPVFVNKKGPVCTDLCPGGEKQVTCAVDPCTDVDNEFVLGSCPAGLKKNAKNCVASQCGGCHAIFVDDLGKEPCEAFHPRRQCEDVSGVKFGKGRQALGFGVVKGQCKVVKGKNKKRWPLFESASECQAQCKCQDIGTLDFGSCASPKSQGWALVDGDCQEVKTCTGFSVPSIAIHKTLQMCRKGCAASITVSEPEPAPETPEAATPEPEGGLRTRCPADRPFQKCRNPCTTSPAPACAEARGKHLVCVPDYCGACEARFLLDGEVFECPAQTDECEAGSEGCCPSGKLPRTDCAQFDCHAEHCQDAVSCEHDPCAECAPMFKNVNGQIVPDFLCRGNQNPEEYRVCGKDDAECCDSGFQPRDCATALGLQEGAVEQTCSRIDCGVNVQECKFDGCDKCQLKLYADDSSLITREQCSIPVPDVCPTVTCPDLGEPACGPRPVQCDPTWKLTCIVDKCACKWRWFSADIREPSNACAQALQQCTAPQDCPTEFECEPPSEQLKSSLSAKVIDQLQCAQESCSCRPTLRPPFTGIREECSADTAGCCDDGLLPSPSCSANVAQLSCAKVVCDGSDKKADSCVADGCKACGLTIWDEDGNEIDHSKCKINVIDEIVDVCQNVVCTEESMVGMECPPRPGCYPDDWKLECILDPCTCRPIWVAEDIRSVDRTCAATIVPASVPVGECPKDFACVPVPDAVKDTIPADVQSQLVCVQEPGTCRPVHTLPEWLPAGFRLPCTDNSCCNDGQGPAVCQKSLSQTACELAVCDSERPARCESDGCNDCGLVLFAQSGEVIDVSTCKIPYRGPAACLATPCSAVMSECPPRPAACAPDFNMRCVQDPCMCSRMIWVMEDLRMASNECTSSIMRTNQASEGMQAIQS